MNAAAKPASRRPPPKARPSRRSGAGGTLIGVFIGLVLGLGLAAGVAYYLMKANGPFPAGGGKETKEARDAGKEPSRTAKADAAASDGKPRFDFYKVLPGVEEPKVQGDLRASPDKALVDQAKAAGDKGGAEKAAADKAAADKAATDKAAAAKAGDKAPDKVASAAATTASSATTAAKLPERFWLQAGSFASESDAENLKARLAFAGFQASVQQGTLPDKGIRYRVRLGPFDNSDEIARIRSDLTKGGFDVAVIKF